MTTNKHVEYQVSLSSAETEVTTWSIANTDHVLIQMKREIDTITLNGLMLVRKAFSINLFQFEDCWWEIFVQKLWNTID